MSDTLPKEILLCSTPRSGSTLLAEALFHTGCFGYPEEFFNNDQANKGDNTQTLFEKYYATVGAESYADYLEKLPARFQSDNGVHCVKMHFRHLDQALRAGYFQRPADRFYVFVHRADLAAQAASLAIAKKTQKWNSSMRTAHKGEVVISDALLMQAYRETVRDKQGWNAFFDIFDLPYLRLEYREITSDIAGAVGRIARHSGVTVGKDALYSLESRVTLTKQATRLNAVLKERVQDMQLDLFTEVSGLFYKNTVSV